MFLIQIYLDIRSYHFLDTNIFGYSFVSKSIRMSHSVSFTINLKGCFGLDRNSNEKAFYPYKEAAMLLIKISISKFLRERSGILIIILIHSIMISMMMMRVMKISLMKMRVGNERLMESDIAKRYCQPMQPSSLSTSSSSSSLGPGRPSAGWA